MMMMVMAFVASSLGAVREEEADGYVDNIVVRPVSRLRWLSGRLLMPV
jgi:putative exporter of polyketide antibiotics